MPPKAQDPTPASNPAPQQPTMEREYAQALTDIFNRFALADQRSYYEARIKINRDAARGVNFMRALFTLIAALASITASIVVSTMAGESCAVASENSTCSALSVLAIISVVAPAIGAGFTSLADLFQWNRLVQVYEISLENLAVADAETPLEKMNDTSFIYSQKAFSEGALSVMRDEQTQWGTLIRTPPQVEQFVQDAQRRGEEMERRQKEAIRRARDSAPPPLRNPFSPPEDQP